MGNVIGEPFKEYIDKQIKKRQEIHGKKDRTIEEISYLNSTLAWVKLASGVSLTQERLDLLKNQYGNSIVNNIKPGKELATKNVLFNGLTSMGSTNYTQEQSTENLSETLGIPYADRDVTVTSDVENFKNSQQQRTGFLGANGAYGIGGNDFGIVPMPGIVSMDSQDLNRGSIKKSRVKIKAYNKQQFDVIDVLYLRLGYTVLLEFGNSQYWDSGDLTKAGKNKLTKMGTTLVDTDFFRIDENYYELLEKIEDKRRQCRGNYNAILGKIVNFSWTFSKDGTYDIDLDIISVGDVIESLKLNLPPLKSIGNAQKFSDRQAVLSQLSTRTADNLKEFFIIYPNLEEELDKWYKNAASGDLDTPNKESVQFSIAKLPHISSPAKRNYNMLSGEGRNVISNQSYKPETTIGGVGRTVSTGTITVGNVPDGNKIGTDVLDKQQLSDLLKEAITFAIIMKINGYYGGVGFGNPYAFSYKPKTQRAKEALAKLEGVDVDKLTDAMYRGKNNPLYNNLDPLRKQTIDLFHEKFIVDTLNYSNDGKTTEGLVGLNSMLSNVKKINGYNKGFTTNNLSKDFYKNVVGVITNATFNEQKLVPSKQFQKSPDGQPFYANTGNATLSPKSGNINFNNPYKSNTIATGNRVFAQTDIKFYLDPYYRHASLFYLLFNSPGRNVSYFDDNYIKNIKSMTAAQRRNGTINLLKNLSLTEFKELVFLFFKEMNAAGGTEDNQFKDNPTFSSYAQELEFEKSKDRIHSWFYRVRKFYTGITSTSANLYEIVDLQGNPIKSQKPGEVFFPITVNGPSNKIKIGKVLNPYDVIKLKVPQQSTTNSNPLTTQNPVTNIVTGLTQTTSNTNTTPLMLQGVTTQQQKSDFQKAIIEKWDSSVGYPQYNIKSGTVDFFVLDDFKVSAGGSGEFNLSGDGKYKFYIKLKVLLDFIEDAIIPTIVPARKNGKKVPLLKIDTDTNSNICYAIDNMLSTNIKSCIIRNDEFTCYKNANIERNKLFEGIDYFLGKSSDGNYKYGRPMNIYLNFEFVQNLLDKIKGKTGDSVLFDFLKNICDEINSCLGNVNNLEPVIDHDINTIKIIDQTPIPGLTEILKSLKDDNGNKAYPQFTKSSPAILELYGYKGNTSNFVHNVGLTTTISKRYASMITIGATADGAIPGMEATAFSKWNTGVIDRIKPEIVDGGINSYTSASMESQNQEVIKRYVNFITINSEDDQFKLLGLSKDGTFNEIYQKNNPSIVSDYFNYAQAESSKTGSLESSVGFLPFNLKIDMEGISGMKIYNRLNVDTRFLPSNYPETLDFIITKVNHKLANNTWTTTLETQATKIIEDNKKSSIINTPKILKSPEFVEILESSTDGVVTPPISYTGKNGNLQDSELKDLSEIGLKSQKLVPDAADAFIKMWKDMKKAGLKPFLTDTYRTYASQYRIFDIDLFISTGGTATKRSGKNANGGFIKKTKKGTGGKTAVAYPGTSNHGWGKAIDIGGINSKESQKVRCWIKQYGVKYGWSWFEGRSAKEDWHFTYDPSKKETWNESFKGANCNFTPTK
jgi:LAS superfamily LD-carboxypeptidase LdcB